MMLLSLSKKILKFFYPLMPLGILRRCILRLCGYRIGKQVYLPSSLRISDLKSNRRNVCIGDRASIGPNVLIITDSSPNQSRLIKLYPFVSKDVILGEDVWIGASVTILPGVTIGKCSVIAAGSVVTKNIPEYSVAKGTPATVVKKIDPCQLI